MTADVPQLTLDLECKRCGTRPNIRALPAFLVLVRDADPDHVIGMWECQSTKCTARVPITVGAIQRAATPVLTEGADGA